MTGPERPESSAANEPVQRVVLNTSAMRGIADAMTSSDMSGVVNRRWGLIEAINVGTDTVDVNLDATVVPGVRRVASYTPTIGERVMLDVVDTDMVVTGPVATPARPTARRDVGDFEPTIRPTPKPGSLFAQGQTLTRASYPELWAWIVEQGLSPSVFGAGNGSTTFTMPDWRGYALSGSTAARPVGTKFGATERVITPANMAAHTHQVQVRDHMSGAGQTPADVGSDIVSHNHGFGTSGVGDHGFHRPNEAPGAIGGGATWTAIGHIGGGGHAHNGTTGNANSAHDHYVYIPPHAVTEVVVGTNTPFNIEQPTVTVNWMIYV